MSSPTLHRHRPAAHPAPPPAPAAGAGTGSSEQLASRPAAPGPLQPTDSPAARYRYDAHAGSWWWAPEMYELHGLLPATAQPSTELFLQHQHPHDRSRVEAALLAAGRDGRSFSLQSRLLRTDGTQRTVVVLGEPTVDASGAVTGVDGLCIDVTEGRGPADGDRVHELEIEVAQLRTAMANRAAIEQAKGILMLLTNCSDQVAFELLAHISSHTHRKVRDVAVSIVESAAGHSGLPNDVRAIIRDACPPSRSTG